MKVLVSEKDVFDLDCQQSKQIDSKMCVYDYSLKEDSDFYFKKITTFIYYRYPAVEIRINNQHNISLPLNWRVMVTNPYDQICNLIGMEDLLHFGSQIPVFNPFYPGIPHIYDIEITNINPNHIQWFVPKLPKKNFLAMPLSEYNIVNYSKDNICKYPICFYANDDIDNSKCELNLYGDLIV